MIPLDLLAFDIREAFEGEKFQTALDWLPQQEHGSVKRFKYERDQHLALASLLIKRYYFSKRLNIPWPSLEFERLSLGKPFLKNEVIDFNTSHQENWVIFGAAMTKDIKIGIDVVTIDRPKSFSIDSFIKSFHPQLTQKEIEFIMNHQDENVRLIIFYQLWACKESYVKAIGVGLSIELNKLDFRNENNQIKMNFEGKKLESWCFHLSYLDKNTLAVVCFGNESDCKLDSKLLEFSSTTNLLGEEPLHIMTNRVFDQLEYKDIKNNK